MMTRRTLDGALKCALRDFLREECRAVDILELVLRVLPGKRVINAYRY